MFLPSLTPFKICGSKEPFFVDILAFSGVLRLLFSDAKSGVFLTFYNTLNVSFNSIFTVFPVKVMFSAIVDKINFFSSGFAFKKLYTRFFKVNIGNFIKLMHTTSLA